MSLIISFVLLLQGYKHYGYEKMTFSILIIAFYSLRLREVYFSLHCIFWAYSLKFFSPASLQFQILHIFQDSAHVYISLLLRLILIFSSVQSLSHVLLSGTPWTAACQASLSITNSQSSLRLMSIESVMPSSHLILFCPLLLLPPIPPSIMVFPMSQLFVWGGQSTGVSALASFLPKNTQGSSKFFGFKKRNVSDFSVFSKIFSPKDIIDDW